MLPDLTPQTKPENVQETGTVVDADTGKPVAVFTVTEGQWDQAIFGYDWSGTGKATRSGTTRRRSGREVGDKGPTTFSNGTFSLLLRKQGFGPGVLIEAEGYLPQSFGPLSDAESNLTVSLKRGTGPAGRVLKPDGQPLANITVYLTDRKNRVYLSGKTSEVDKTSYPHIRRTQTDAEGRFAFAAQIYDTAVIVVDEAGYGQVSVEDLKQSPEVRLQPWARVEGTLMVGTQPGTNESIMLSVTDRPYAYYPAIGGSSNAIPSGHNGQCGAICLRACSAGGHRGLSLAEGARRGTWNNSRIANH